MYIPEAFAPGDPADIARLIDDYPFAALITTVEGGEPQITHLPLLREDGALTGHVARANPHWLHFARGRTLAVFAGPHAYVSPRSYRDPQNSVPTWNYAVVHVHGTPELLADRETHAALERLTRRFDPQFAVVPERIRRLLSAIVAFRLPMTRIDAKFKMSQNRSAEDRAGVITALSAAADDLSRESARWMQAHDR